MKCLLCLNCVADRPELILGKGVAKGTLVAMLDVRRCVVVLKF